MIRYLNSDISFCEMDGRLFFLDIQNDQYFQLSETLEHNFLSYLEHPDNTDIDVSRLAKHGLLPQTTATRYATTDIAIPRQSALENPCPDKRIPINVIHDVFLIVVIMHWQLKMRRLKTILQTLSDYRHTRILQSVEDETGFQECLMEAAASFNRVRPYVPIETCCLIDSLSMTRFLAKRGLHARLVMGVACDPFSAHAWAQHGSLVLNETMGTVLAHVPIRVI